MANLADTINDAIADVATKISLGKYIVEYRVGSTLVKKESPVALLKALRELRDETAAASQDRCASSACFGGVQ